MSAVDGKELDQICQTFVETHDDRKKTFVATTRHIKEAMSLKGRRYSWQNCSIYDLVIQSSQVKKL